MNGGRVTTTTRHKPAKPAGARGLAARQRKDEGPGRPAPAGDMSSALLPAHSTWEQIGRDARRKMKRMRARFASTCPQCRAPIAIDDPIVQPYALNERKGNRFHGCWYCDDCGEFLQRGVDCGALAFRGPWLTVADRDAFEERPDVQAWRAESRRRGGVV